MPTETATPIMTDTAALDAIATILGTAAEWDSETIEYVAEVVRQVRPDPDLAPEWFARGFVARTGRKVPSRYDAR